MRSATSTSPTRRPPSLQHRRDQEQGRQVRRADARRCAAAAVGGATVERRPHVQPAQRVGRRRLPDHRADVHHRLREADATRRRATTVKGWLNYVLDRRPGPGRTTSTTRRCPTACSGQAHRPARPDQIPANRLQPHGEPRRSGRRTEPAGHVTHGRRRRRVGRPHRSAASPSAPACSVLAILALIAYLDDEAGVAGVPARGLSLRHRRRLGSRTRTSSARSPSSTARCSPSSIALVLAVPVSLGIALFTTELAPRRLRTPVDLRRSTCSPRSRRSSTASGASLVLGARGSTP